MIYHGSPFKGHKQTYKAQWPSREKGTLTSLDQIWRNKVEQVEVAERPGSKPTIGHLFISAVSPTPAESFSSFSNPYPILLALIYAPKMPETTPLTLHLLSLRPNITVASFFLSLAHSPSTALITAKVIRWIIPPTACKLYKFLATID